jgi:autotransporter passenger strand-loop-strand repeat protein
MSDIPVTQVVFTGTTWVTSATDTNYIVLGSGVLRLGNGGVVFGATAIGAGSSMMIETGGTATNSTIAVGAVQFNFGNAIGTVVSNGGTQHVYNGGTASNTTIATGSYQDVYYAMVSDTNLSGYQQVLAGGIANGTVISNAGLEYVGVGGTANATVVTSGGLQYVDVGATDNNAVIENGGFQYVSGATTGSKVQSGGIQDIIGTSLNVTVAGGAVQHVLNGGVATGTHILDNGTQDVANGAVVNTTVAGGYLNVLAGGIATGTALSGGDETVFAGGTTHDVDFAGAASTLTLFDPSSLTGTVSHFEIGDVIDFRGLSITSYVFDGSTLTLASGVSTYSYHFDAMQAGTELNVASDGHGGSAVSLSLLSQFAASFGGSSASSEAPLVPADPEPAPTLAAHA